MPKAPIVRSKTAPTGSAMDTADTQVVTGVHCACMVQLLCVAYKTGFMVVYIYLRDEGLRWLGFRSLLIVSSLIINECTLFYRGFFHF